MHWCDIVGAVLVPLAELVSVPVHWGVVGTVLVPLAELVPVPVHWGVLGVVLDLLGCEAYVVPDHSLLALERVVSGGHVPPQDEVSGVLEVVPLAEALAAAVVGQERCQAWPHLPLCQVLEKVQELPLASAVFLHDLSLLLSLLSWLLKTEIQFCYPHQVLFTTVCSCNTIN